MGKRLNTLLLSFLFTSFSLFSQDFLPEKFKNYREKADSLYSKVISLPNIGLANMYFYDVDKDKKSDVEEIYLIKFSPLVNKLEQEKEPLFYILDINGDGCIEYGELLIDEKMDGLNGNEQFCNLLRPKKPSPIKL